METATASAAPTSMPEGGKWAPGALPMVACTALMVFFMFFSSLVVNLLMPDRPAAGAFVAFAGLVASAVLSHFYYRRAKEALAQDARLRGRWLVENSWWLLPILGLALPLVGIVTAIGVLS